jgi:hypothetical protein
MKTGCLAKPGGKKLSGFVAGGAPSAPDSAAALRTKGDRRHNRRRDSKAQIRFGLAETAALARWRIWGGAHSIPKFSS